MSKYLESTIRLVGDLLESDVHVGYEDVVLILCAVEIGGQPAFTASALGRRPWAAVGKPEVKLRIDTASV